MKVFEFGDAEKQSLLLLPDALCYWENTFSTFIQYARKHYHVFAVSYDGMEDDGTVFESCEKTADEIENYITEKNGGKIDAIYGSGMGGLIGTLIVTREKVVADHLIISGTSFSNPNAFMAKIAANKKADDAVNVFTNGAMPSQLGKMAGKLDTQKYAENVAKIYEIGTTKRAYISRETAFNMFYSQSQTSVPDKIVTNTKIHAFHYIPVGDIVFNRYKKHFVEPEIKLFDMEFEDMLFTYPKNLVVMVRVCTGQLCKK